MAWVTPKIDWVANPTNPVATDMNRIEGNIDFLNTEIETKKGEIVSALVDMNQASTIADSYATLGLKIKSISKDASATIAQVLTGATFYQDGVKKTGTMVNRGNLSSSLAINGSYTIPQGYHAGSGVVSQSITTKSAQTYTPSTANQTIASGQYLSGIQTILGDADLVAGNILSGKNIFGVDGNITTRFASGTIATYYNSPSVDTSINIGFQPDLVVISSNGNTIPSEILSGTAIFYVYEGGVGTTASKNVTFYRNGSSSSNSSVVGFSTARINSTGFTVRVADYNYATQGKKYFAVKF